jgi:dihydroorotate dehydrogenase (NAD+) catalytic subunit
MKPRKRVVTGPSAGGRAAAARRTPTVRRIRSAIVPVGRGPRPGPTGADGRPSGATAASGGAPAADPRTSSLAAVDLSAEVAPRTGLRLRNPILVAAGCAGYGPEVAAAVDLGALGAIVTRTTTLRPRDGSPAPRLVERAGAVVWATGLPNPGIDAVLERYAPAWPTLPTAVVVSIGGEAAGEVGELVRRLEDVSGVAALELDLAHLRPGPPDPAPMAALVAAARRATERPLVVKLPYVEDPRRLGRAVVDAGADALAGPGGLRGRVLGAAGGRLARPPALGVGRGFLAGPVLLPLSLDFVAELAAGVRIPVVGLGGVRSVDDVLDYLAAGASAVGVGTAALADPALPGRLAEALRRICAQAGIADLGALRDRLRRGPDGTAAGRTLLP